MRVNNIIKYQKRNIKIMKKQTYRAIIGQNEEGGFIGKVPELYGCLSQGDTLNELVKNIQEAIELCLEVERGVN